MRIEPNTGNVVPRAHGPNRGRKRVSGLCCALVLSFVIPGALAQPANDNFDSAEVIAGSTGTVSGDTTGATAESGEPRHFGTGGASVWYRWTPANSGIITFDTVGSGFDTVLVAYTGTNLSSLTKVAGNDDAEAGITASRISFSAVAGVEYRIAVDGITSSNFFFVVLGSGPFMLQWQPGDIAVPREVKAGEFNFSSPSYRATEFETFQAFQFNNPIDDFPTVNSRSPRGAVITVTRTNGTAGRVLVDYTLVGGDPLLVPCDDTNTTVAVAGCHYLDVSGTLAFDDFQMSASFIIPVFSDLANNGNKTLDLVLSNPRPDPEEEAQNPGLIAPVLGGRSMATLTILEIFRPGATSAYAVTNFSIERTRYAVDEFRFSNGVPVAAIVVVDVILHGNGPGTVDYETFAGIRVGYGLSAASDYANSTDFVWPQSPYTDGANTITNWADYTGQTVRLSFGANQNRLSVTNIIFNDPMVEFNEDILVLLRPVQNQPGLGRNPLANITIMFEDQPAGALDREWNPDLVSYTTPRFNDTPGANSTVRALAVQADGRTVIGGDFTAYNSAPRNRIARINPDGSLDGSFNPGSGANGYVSTVALYPVNPTNSTPHGGKVVVGGGFTSINNIQRNSIARLNANGSLDNSFAVGRGANAVIHSVALQSDGKVLIAGDFTQYNGVDRSRIARLNADGTLDAGFNPGLGADGTIWSVAVRDSQQNIFVPRAAEGFEFEDVNEIEAGANQGVVTIDYDFINIPDNLRVYYDGIRIFDITTNGIGQLMVPFGPGASTRVTIIVNEGTGLPGTAWRYTANITVPVLERKIFIGGEFLSFDNQYRSGVARLNDDGSLDLAYDSGGGADGPVYTVAPQADGRLLLGGAFTSVDFRTRINLARLENSGALDLSYDPGSGANDAVYSIALQPDGKALVGGVFTRFNQTRRVGLTRLFLNGTVDTSFLDTAYNQFAGLINSYHFQPPNYVNAVAAFTHTNVITQTISNVTTTNITVSDYVMIGGSFTNVGGNFALELNRIGTFPWAWSRQDKRPRFNVARLIGGYTPGPGNVEFVSDENTTDEYGGRLEVAMRRIDGRLGTVQAEATTMDNLAVSGVDFDYAKSIQTWFEDGTPFITPISVGYAGETFFPIFIHNDSAVEGDELLGAMFKNPVGSIYLGGEAIPLGAALGRAASTVSVIDDDAAHGTFVFNSTTYTTNENAGTNLIEVIRINGSNGLARVRYYTIDGTAIGGQDYTPTNGTLTFASGVTTQYIRVRISNDNFIEPDENFTIVLTNATGATLPDGMPNSSVSATGIIIDNDFVSGRARFASATYATNEGAGVAEIALVRSGGSSGELTVSVAATNGLATSGSDFTALTNTITWVHNDVAPKIFMVPLINDLVPEGDETVGLRIFNPSVAGAIGSVSNATLTIREDDFHGALSFSQSIFDADERGTNITITVIRTGGVGGTVSVQYRIINGTALNGTNFIASDGTLTFGPGVTATNFQITILNNDLMDGDRIATLLLTNFTLATAGAQPVATLRIFDDESIGGLAGSLDTTFNPAAGGTNAIHSLLLQPDGAILVGGEFRTMNRVPRNRVARLFEDGSLDRNFNSSVGPNGPVRTMVLQPDGRVVIGGFFDQVHATNRNHIARLLADGTMDRLFDPGAGADNPVHALALLPDGRIVAGGSFATYNGFSRAGIAVIESDGGLSTTFNPGSRVNGTVFAVAIQNDGKILIGGEFTINGVTRPRLARLNLDGSVDLSFDAGNGPNGAVQAITLQPDGKILIGGSFTSVNGTGRSRLARLEANGNLDSAFLDGLEGANDDVSAIRLQFDGNIIVVGDFTRFNGVTRNRITRLHASGRSDPTINFGAGANESINTVLIQPDRKIVVGGRFTTFDGEPRSLLARLHGGSIAGPGSLQFSAPFYSVVESSGSANIVVRRQGGLSGDVMVNYLTAPGSAMPGSDYTSVANTLTFPEGESHRSFAVPISNDSIGEPDETVLLLLTNQTAGVTLGAVPDATLTILNDDSGVGFSSASYTVNENAVGGGLLITVVRSGATNGTARVNYATVDGSAIANQDYTAASGQLTFPPGETIQTFTVPIREDDLIEANETFGVILTNLSGSAGLIIASATVTIIDNDFRPGNITFQAPAYSVTESGGSVTITVLRTNGATGAVAVDYATIAGTASAGSDFEARSDTLTFPEGVTNLTITITILDDSLVEGDETFLVRLSNPSAGATISGPTNVTITIVDEEFGPGSLDRSFDPGAGANNFVSSLAVGANGKIVIGGAFTMFDNTNRNRIARLNADGSHDLSFNPGSGADALVNAVVVLPDGNVSLGGSFTHINGAPYNRVGRLLADGSRDFNFNQLPDFDASVNSMAAHSDGRLAVGGGFSQPSAGIIQLRGDGGVDSSFDPGIGANAPVLCVITRPDGRVVIGGSFTTVRGEPSTRVAQFQANGDVDHGFVPDAITSGAVYGLAVQGDGKIVAVGDFVTTAGTNRVNVARFNVDGSLDASFNVGTGPNAIVFAVGVQSQGKIIIGGSFTSINGVTRLRYARLLSHGALDTAFDPGTGANNTVYALRILPNDNLLIGGNFTVVNGVPRNRIARIIATDAAGVSIAPFQYSAGAAAQVTVNSIPGATYVLETSADLVNWATVSSGTASGATLTLTDPNAGSFNQRFYRVFQMTP